MGSQSHLQHDSNVQRRPSHLDIRLSLLLDRRPHHRSIPSRAGLNGSNIRRTVPLGLHACPSPLFRLPQLDHGLECGSRLDSESHSRSVVCRNDDPRPVGPQLPFLRLRALARHAHPFRRPTMLCNRQHAPRAHLSTHRNLRASLAPRRLLRDHDPASRPSAKGIPIIRLHGIHRRSRLEQ